MDRIIGVIRFNIIKILTYKKMRIKGLKGHIGYGSKIIAKNRSNINIGDKIWISDYCAVVSTGKGITIGNNCYFNSNVRIFSIDSITIGDNCLFGPNIVIIDHDHNHEKAEQPFCKQGYTSEEIKIGNNVWIGANCVIGKGIKIVDNVVVGAGSIISKSLLQEGVYVGAPAKKIKEL